MRPPVPLFSNKSTEGMSRRTSHAEGSFGPELSLRLSNMLTSTPTGMPEAQPFADFLDFSGDEEPESTQSFFPAVNYAPPSMEPFEQTTSALFDENVSPCVSLQDVQLNSEPVSTSFTNLTTPGSDPIDSPYTYSTDTSPNFAVENHFNVEDWPSLFPGDNTSNDKLIAHSIEQTMQDIQVAPQMSRNTSSPGKSSSRSSNQGRHSLTSGVSSRRRDKPLPAITIDDPSDHVKVKRARNTMAARKSREKRVQRHEQLETQVAELQRQVDYWKDIATDLGHME